MATTEKTMASVKEARELYELKQKAAQFYAENGVPAKMEDILNSMFYDNPNDVYGHLANYFQGFAQPAKITSVQARSAFDAKGQRTILTDIFCSVNNKTKLLASSVNSSVSPLLSELAKPEELDDEAKDREAGLEAAINIINKEIASRLQGLQPTAQADIDKVITGYIGELKAAEDERIAREAETQANTEGSDNEKKPGSSITKDKPKSGKGGKGGKGGAPVVVVPDEPRERMVAGSVCLSATSQAVCQAGAAADGNEVYEHVAALRFGQAPQQYRMPLPMVTIFQSGRAAPGKSNCVKEYMLVSPPGKLLNESVPKIFAVYNDVVKAIMGKNGSTPNKKAEKIVARNVTDLGALMVSFDRPEQGLDMIQESMTRLGLTPGEDLYLGLNLAGHEIFDYDIPTGKEKVSQSFPLAEKKLAISSVDEKGKYEVVTGQQKAADDVIDFWVDIITRYPAIIAIIDPFRKQEGQQWMSLCEKISEKCYILGDNVWHRPGLLKDEELTDTFRSSGNVYRLEQMNTITNILECAKKTEEAGNETVLSTNIGDTTDVFLADMAVGMNARFLKVGGASRGERVSKLNRLISLELALQGCGTLAPGGDFSFPVITLPPPPEPEEGDAEEAEVKDSPRKK
ncbi:enolase 4-like isoform X3 [Mya arenaria]|uniref:enolase 4-like isoform X3 n=1 Tax=Mya arenaria TaxID=6604 RepID=UPI0022E8EB23|nr:enolase 4-like isoform X3 [Mya arenaria]